MVVDIHSSQGIRFRQQKASRGPGLRPVKSRLQQPRRGNRRRNVPQLHHRHCRICGAASAALRDAAAARGHPLLRRHQRLHRVGGDDLRAPVGAVAGPGRSSRLIRCRLEARCGRGRREDGGSGSVLSRHCDVPVLRLCPSSTRATWCEKDPSRHQAYNKLSVAAAISQTRPPLPHESPRHHPTPIPARTDFAAQRQHFALPPDASDVPPLHCRMSHRSVVTPAYRRVERIVNVHRGAARVRVRDGGHRLVIRASDNVNHRSRGVSRRYPSPPKAPRPR